MNGKNVMKRCAKARGSAIGAGTLAMALWLGGAGLARGHSDLTTHPKLMDYAVQLAKNDPNLALPFAGNMAAPGPEWTRLKEGSRQEDEGIRCFNHFYNPMDNGAMINAGVVLDTAREQSLDHWGEVANAFLAGQFNGGDGVGAWHWLGRTSHLMQDMTAILHVLNFQHLSPSCQFEAFWANNQPMLDNVLNPVNGALFADSALPPEATAKLDAHSGARLLNWFNSPANNANGPVGCPNRGNNDVRGYFEILAWMTYFRTTVWGEIRFNGNNQAATTPTTTATAFSDGNVGEQANALHAMFNGNVRSRISWGDWFYEITDRQGSVFRYKSYTDMDDWAACGQPDPLGWSSGKQDSSKLAEGDDDDDDDARVTGRFWFDARELGKNSNGQFDRLCYPHKYPDGTAMAEDLHEYQGRRLFPLTVRYNAGLIGLANRRATVGASSGTANVTLSRRDNFGVGPNVVASTVGQSFYFAAKSAVTLTAPAQNSQGWTFVHWSRRSGLDQAENKVYNVAITINGAADPISRHGETLTAVYMGAPIAVSATDGTEQDRVRITWVGVLGATHYRVYRHTANNSAAAAALGNWQAGTTFDDVTATPGTTYYYWVKAATSAAGTVASGFSASDTGWRKLAVPTGVVAAGSTANVVVSWNAVPGATHYRVYRNTSGLLGYLSNGGFVLLAQPVTGWQAGTSFTDNSAAMLHNYYWIQAAKDANGTRASGYSARAMGYRYPALILIPKGMDDTTTAQGGTPKWWMDAFNLASIGAGYDDIENTDPDGDGMSVRDEYVAGTDPMDSASVLAARMDAANGGNAVLQWQGVPGRVYQVMRTDALGDGKWTPVGEPIRCSDVETLLYEPESDGKESLNFYRVGVDLESDTCPR